jgi:hypothetical protein
MISVSNMERLSSQSFWEVDSYCSLTQELRIGKRVNVTGGIWSVPGYKRMERS